MAPAAAESKKEKDVKKDETKTKDEPKKEEEVELVRGYYIFYLSMCLFNCIGDTKT